MSIEKLYDAFVELVSKNGRPFNITSDSGMRCIIDPIIEGITKSAGEKITINEVVVKEKLHEACEHVKNKIRAEVQNKPLALMLDIATKHNRSIFGINVRFYNGKSFVTRTIGMQLLTKRHAAPDIYAVLSNTLNDFGIDTIQLIAYSTDNAGNVVNVVDWLNRDYEEFQMNQDFDVENEVFASLDNDFFGRLIDEISSTLNDQQITHIPCALKMAEFDEEIKFVKEIVKELRTPTFSNLLYERKLKQAVIDHDVRWNYTYLMVKRKHL